MKSKLTTMFVGAALLLAPFHFSYSKAGGVYRGISKGNVRTITGSPPAPLANALIKQRLPNGKGKMSGVLLTGSGGAANVGILGNVKKHLVRQGGKKHIYVGNWTWRFSAVGAPSDASGNFRTIIKKIGNRYKFARPVNVRLRGNGPPAFTFRSKVTGRK